VHVQIHVMYTNSHRTWRHIRVYLEYSGARTDPHDVHQLSQDLAAHQGVFGIKWCTYRSTSRTLNLREIGCTSRFSWCSMVHIQIYVMYTNSQRNWRHIRVYLEYNGARTDPVR
jgi:heptaprenylglyceryl phosphate synthase